MGLSPGGDTILSAPGHGVAAGYLPAVKPALRGGKEIPFACGRLPIPAVGPALIDIPIRRRVEIAPAARALPDVGQQLRAARHFSGAQGILRT